MSTPADKQPTKEQPTPQTMDKEPVTTGLEKLAIIDDPMEEVQQDKDPKPANLTNPKEEEPTGKSSTMAALWESKKRLYGNSLPSKTTSKFTVPCASSAIQTV
ncbi:hypothetical protein BJV82DRAFT_676652 [Fennellomyces sp. T-0311]|nr:hypothetical protein BJV82DRAFT_676652 [Fennellomyces sp. T-0311]